MEAMRISEVLEAVKGRLLGDFQDLDATISAVDIDSRKIHPGSLFVPLVGERFDGHSFITDSLNAGAAGCFTARERDSYLPGKFYLKVDSTQKALRDLAERYKSRFPIPFVSVTGSVGKTTTKEMVAAVLGERLKVLKTAGNFNSSVGLPLTLLRLESGHQAAVLEMGMNQAGEIEYLSRLVKPDIALITNIGDSHIENLGSRENILKAKSEIFIGMQEGGTAVLNGDDPLLRSLEGRLNSLDVVWCGEGENCDYRAVDVDESHSDHIECTIRTPRGSFRCEIPGLGRHMLYPVLMAAAVGERFGLSHEEIAQGVLHFAPTKMRMNILHRGADITILDDTYNANPQSMRAAVEVLSKSKGHPRIAVLGDMFELGALAPTLHAGVGDFLARSGVEYLVAVGRLARHIYDAAKGSLEERAYCCADKEEAREVLRLLVRPGCTVLLKASRGMAFEELTEYVKGLTTEAQPDGAR